MAFQLDTFEKYETNLNEGRVIEIIDPVSGLPTGLEIRVVSYESTRVKDAVRKAAAKIPKDDRGSKEALIRRNEEMTMTVACAAIVSWTGWDDEDGNPVPCDLENIRHLLASSGEVRKQVDAAADDATGFFTK